MYNGSLRLKDVDANGTVELLLKGGAEGGFAGQRSAPQLRETHTWMWNGSEYTFVDVTFSAPRLKFQAVQAADLYSRMGQYERAFELYHRAIYDDRLIAWNSAWNEPLGGGYEVYPTRPPEDNAQGERIHAYARFKIMVTRYLIGDLTGAELQFDANRSIHPEGNDGYAYARLSEVFRQTYLANQSVAAGCSAVRNYADLHEQEVLWPLGVGVYGEANPDYQPVDLCPFKY